MVVGEQVWGQRDRIIESLHDVLLHEWDPIGIATEPNAHDEYDSYIAGAYGLLASHAPSEEIETYLSNIETAKMGLRRSSKERLQSGVQKIRTIFSAAPG